MYLSDLISFATDAKEFVGLYLQKITSITPVDFLLDFSNKQSFFISLNNQSPFIASTPTKEITIISPKLPSFIIDARSFLGGQLADVQILGNDLVLAFTFIKTNRIFEKEEIILIIELIPNHPNALIVNHEQKIIALYRTAQNKRILKRSFLYELPTQTNFSDTKPNQSFNFLKHYYHSNLPELFKIFNNDVTQYLEKTIKRLKQLKNNYVKDLTMGQNYPIYYEYGHLLLTYQPIITTDVVVLDDRSIPVNEHFSTPQNAELYFKKAKKLKTATTILKDKIIDTKTKLNYYIEILNRLGFLTTSDEYDEIRHELGLSQHQKQKPKVIKAFMPYYFIINGTKILFGKNNEQNDYLTFKKANRDSTFVHIHNYPGAHIIIENPAPAQKVLELAGHLALYLSNKETAEVSYTPIKYVKKGQFPGQVIIRSEQTFFVKLNMALILPYFSSALRG